jgi:Xaa-Pro aminopeptidase
MQLKKHRLIEINYPEFGGGEKPAPASLEEFRSRIAAARQAMQERELTHLVVYGDREHFANLAYLTNFDPRFEEALLIVEPSGKPLLVTGNECSGYLDVSPLYAAGDLRHERFQTFSLLGQPRESSRLIREIFAGEGIGQGAKVGCSGWKYFAETEHPDPQHAVDLPAYLADTLRELAGRENVINVTDIFMHPDYGLRSFCSAAEIAYFEYTNVLASQAVKRMLCGMREGMLDLAVARLAGYDGEPFGCHMTMVTGANRTYGLSSPIGAVLRKGDPFATNVCYWGSNICRAGWVAGSGSDLTDGAGDYVENFAGPYFEVLVEWYRRLTIGRLGGELSDLVQENLPYEKFGIFLNAGHLIHLDEWVSSPIYPGSTVTLHSGMALQVDVIPDSPVYFSSRMEDGLVLADSALREQLKTGYPATFERCQQRRRFMRDSLGFELPEEVLPLGNLQGIVPPFFLRPNLVFAV